MELTEVVNRGNYVYTQLTGVITVSIIKHNRKKSKHDRGKFGKFPKTF